MLTFEEMRFRHVFSRADLRARGVRTLNNAEATTLKLVLCCALEGADKTTMERAGDIDAGEKTLLKLGEALERRDGCVREWFATCGALRSCDASHY